MVPTHDMLDTIGVCRGMPTDTQTPVDAAVVLTVEDGDRSKDREIAEHPGPPQVPPSAAVGGAKEGQDVIDDAHHDGFERRRSLRLPGNTRSLPAGAVDGNGGGDSNAECRQHVPRQLHTGRDLMGKAALRELAPQCGSYPMQVVDADHDPGDR